jgi:hypothetical protein
LNLYVHLLYALCRALRFQHPPPHEKEANPMSPMPKSLTVHSSTPFPAYSHNQPMYCRWGSRMSLTTCAVMSLSCGIADNAWAEGFTSGNVVVSRVGDGTVALSSAAAPVAVLEFPLNGGAPVTIGLPSTGSGQVTDAGTSTSHGFLNAFAGYVAVSGYNAPAATASVASLNAKVGTLLNASGAVASRTLFPTGGPTGEPPSPFSGSSFRSIFPTGPNTFYAVGTSGGTPNTGGVWHFDGSGFRQISNPVAGPTNLRVVNVFGNQLYVASASGSFNGISAVGSGLPTATAQSTVLVIDTGAGASPYGFVMFDTNGDGTLDRAYVADDRFNIANGGINRFDLAGSSWTRTAAFRFDVSTGLLSDATASVVAIRGLSGRYDAAASSATLFATTTESSNNLLISFVDTGTLSTSTTFTTMATAGANYAFRGVSIFTGESGPECPADLDGNGVVGGGDLTALLAAWGSSAGDIDGDGTTNGTDLTSLLAAWGPCNG